MYKYYVCIGEVIWKNVYPCLAFNLCPLYIKQLLIFWPQVNLTKYRKLTGDHLKSREIKKLLYYWSERYFKILQLSKHLLNSTNSLKLIDYIRSFSGILLCGICSYLLSWQKVPAEVKVTFYPKVGLISINSVSRQAYIGGY